MGIITASIATRKINSVEAMAAPISNVPLSV
jgi:hypothetical protein